MRNRAIALVVPDCSAVAAAIEERGGIPLFSLLSEFAAGVREGMSAPNDKFGRTAAWMIAKADKWPSKVAAFVGSHGFLGHKMREIGSRSYFHEHAPDFDLLIRRSSRHHRDPTRDTRSSAALSRFDRSLYLPPPCGGTISAIREESSKASLSLSSKI